jgi:hypothetical protein
LFSPLIVTWLNLERTQTFLFLSFWYGISVRSRARARAEIPLDTAALLGDTGDMTAELPIERRRPGDEGIPIVFHVQGSLRRSKLFSRYTGDLVGVSCIAPLPRITPRLLTVS